MTLLRTETKPPAFSAASPLKIALVEDKRDVRESWARLINSFPDFTCMCKCASAEDALRMIPSLQPDVILMDIFLKGVGPWYCHIFMWRLRVLGLSRFCQCIKRAKCPRVLACSRPAIHFRVIVVDTRPILLPTS